MEVCIQPLLGLLTDLVERGIQVSLVKYNPPFEPEPSLNEAQPGENLTYSFIWDPDLPQYQLCWHEDDIGYILNLTLYGEEISIEGVVKIAASMH